MEASGTWIRGRGRRFVSRSIYAAVVVSLVPNETHEPRVSASERLAVSLGHLLADLFGAQVDLRRHRLGVGDLF